MRSPAWQPGALWPLIVHRTQYALERGALHPIDTITTVLDDAGVRFLVRQVSSLRRKAQAQVQTPPEHANPFLPYDPDLFVADISPTHFALLNKFNVIDHHLLIVTRAFEHQETLLTLADFDAWCRCLGEFDSLGFYNGGAEAGASQPHKHMQVVPLPLASTDSPMRTEPLPIEPLLAAAPSGPQVCRLPGLPFEHAFARLEPQDAPSRAIAALSCYRGLLDALGMDSGDGSATMRQAAPYNLLMTTRWMLLVARSAHSVENIAVNALGFAGSLFVRDATQLDTIRRLGPMTILRRAARAPDPGA